MTNIEPGPEAGHNADYERAVEIGAKALVPVFYLPDDQEATEVARCVLDALVAAGLVRVLHNDGDQHG